MKVRINFKPALAGYLEHIISDRKLIAYYSIRPDILYFLDCDIDKALEMSAKLSELWGQAIYYKKRRFKIWFFHPE